VLRNDPSDRRSHIALRLLHTPVSPEPIPLRVPPPLAIYRARLVRRRGDLCREWIARYPAPGSEGRPEAIHPNQSTSDGPNYAPHPNVEAGWTLGSLTRLHRPIVPLREGLAIAWSHFRGVLRIDEKGKCTLNKPVAPNPLRRSSKAKPPSGKISRNVRSKDTQ